MPGDPHPHPAGDDAPVTPHATPRRDAEGRPLCMLFEEDLSSEDATRICVAHEEKP